MLYLQDDEADLDQEIKTMAARIYKMTFKYKGRAAVDFLNG